MTPQQIIYFKLNHPQAQLPKRNHPKDVGLDVFCPTEIFLLPHTATKIDLGLQLAGNVNDSEFPYFLKFEGRSGLASQGIFPVGRIIDPEYRGQMIVMLFNGTNNTYHIKPGDKIAQLVYYSIEYPIVAEESTITETTRGDKGFGSSGR